MKIFVNDEAREVAESGCTVREVMLTSGLPAYEGLAVAVNDSVLPRSRWEKHTLGDGDRVLVIRAAQGG